MYVCAFALCSNIIMLCESWNSSVINTANLLTKAKLQEIKNNLFFKEVKKMTAKEKSSSLCSNISSSVKPPIAVASFIPMETN